MNINKEEYEELQSLYKKNVEENNEMFIFKGQEILVSYCKYLLEYLKTKFN